MAYVSVWGIRIGGAYLQHTSAYVSIRQHTSAYVSIRQHTSAYVSIRQNTSAYVSVRQHMRRVVLWAGTWGIRMGGAYLLYLIY